MLKYACKLQKRGVMQVNDVASRRFTIDGDTVEVRRVYDEKIGAHIHDYPDFSKNPRTTKSGRPWVNVTKDDCPYADEKYSDCGSCKHFRCEKAGDLIGVCDNEQLRLQGKEETL